MFVRRPDRGWGIGGRRDSRPACVACMSEVNAVRRQVARTIAFPVDPGYIGVVGERGFGRSVPGVCDEATEGQFVDGTPQPMRRVVLHQEAGGMKLFRSWILRWFVPDELQANADSQRQAIRAILFGFAMLVWWPVFTPLYVWLGSPRAGLIITAAAAAALLIMLSMRWTKSVIVTGNAIASAIYAVLVGLACVAGGIQAAALWWLCAVPIIGLVLGGVCSGFVWAVISTLTTVAFYVLHTMHVAIPSDIPVEHVWLLDFLSIAGIILCAFLLTLTFKLGEDAARRELEIARDASEQANRRRACCWPT